MGQTGLMKDKSAILIRSVAIGALLLLVPLAASTTIDKGPLISLSETAASAQVGSGNQMSDSKMMMPNPFTYVYVAGDSLSEDGGSGDVFELQLTGDPKLILQNVAGALGVEGAIVEPEYSTAEYPAYVIGSIDGTGPSATINWSGTGGWWFSNPSAYPTAACAKMESAEDGTQYCGAYEEQKPTPELLPSKAEMISQAVKLFSATGLKVSPTDIETSLSEWGASAYASLKIGGQDSPIEWTISWGSNGKIGTVSGQSVKAVNRGSYETISDKAAVARMSDWRYSGQLPQSAWAKYQTPPSAEMIAYDGAVKAEPPVVQPTDGVSPEPIPETGPEPTPSTVTVSVNKAIKSQLMIWDKAGKPWIVPGVMLFSKEGWITPVFTLKDGIVELPDPVEISPMVK